MALVRAIRDCFVGAYRKAGDEFEYSGPKNRHLEPVKAAKAEKPGAAEKDTKEPGASKLSAFEKETYSTGEEK